MDKQLSGAAAEEKWLPIPGFEGYYEVSDHGQVRSLDRTVDRSRHSAMKLRGKMLTPQLRKNTGYYVVSLSKDANPRDWYIHRLVLMAFVGLPAEGQEACHQNDIRSDNRLVNLRWDSHLENVRDAVRRGRLVVPNPRQTHCIRGHEYVYDDNQQRNICHPCRRLQERRRYHAKKKRLENA